MDFLKHGSAPDMHDNVRYQSQSTVNWLFRLFSSRSEWRCIFQWTVMNNVVWFSFDTSTIWSVVAWQSVTAKRYRWRMKYRLEAKSVIIFFHVCCANYLVIILLISLCTQFSLCACQCTYLSWFPTPAIMALVSDSIYW